MIFEAELNDSDVKFKIYCKYGNARFEHKSVCHSDSEWLCTINLQGTLLVHFETILKHAERLGYAIQDILYGNAWFERECESFEGLWVNLAFYRELDTAGAIKNFCEYLQVLNDFNMCLRLSSKKIINKLRVHAVTDSDKLALWLRAFFVLFIAGVNILISSQNELWDEKKIIKRRLFQFCKQDL